VATEFPDNTFNIFDETDNTKIAAFDVGTQITTATTQTFQFPDVSGTLITSANPEDLGGVLQDLNTLGAASADGEFIVATGAGAFAYETANTARTSLGVGTGDSPTFTGLTITNAAVLGSDSAVFQPNTDDTDFFQVKDAAGNIMFEIDTSTGSGVSSFFGAPAQHTDIKLLRTHSDTTATQIGADFIIDQDTATAQQVMGLRSAATSSHTSGTMTSLVGYQSVTQTESAGAVTSITAMQGSVGAQAGSSPTITVMTGCVGSVDLREAANTFAFCLSGPPVTKTTGSCAIAIGGYFQEQTVGSAQNASWLALGDSAIASNKKLNFEGALGASGDTYLVYDSVGTTLDCFVNATEVWNASTTTVTVPVNTVLTGNLSGTPDEITATDAGIAASVSTVNTEVTTNGDSDLDNVTLANGVSGQVKHIYCVVEGNAADTWKITPANMVGGTQITFAGVGEGCTLVYADAEGWVVVANNGGTIT
jgi:hypothetical protein